MISNQILNQVKQVCRTYGIKPQRRKGQNFLINPEVIKRLLQAAALSDQDIVLEVGPGLGILTESLVKQVKQVVSVELDQKLFGILKAKFTDIKNLKLVNDDILNFSPETYNLMPAAYKVVANLPYNISSVFLRKFLTTPNRPSSMTLLLQREVAKRICEKPGQLSLLAISVQLYGQPEIIGSVSRENFWPIPEVDSAILKISDIRDQKSVDNFFTGKVSENYFWQIVKIGFSSKRKQLQNNLASGLHISATEAKKLLNQANFDPKIRAQNLSVDNWLKLASVVFRELEK